MPHAERIARISRFGLALVFLATAALKAADATGTAWALRGMVGAEGLPVSSFLALAWTIVVAECALGACLLAAPPVWVRRASAAVAVLAAAYGAFLLAGCAEGAKPRSCACFGVFSADHATCAGEIGRLAVLAAWAGVVALLARTGAAASRAPAAPQPALGAA